MRVVAAVLAAACGIFLSGTALGDGVEQDSDYGQSSPLSGPVSERAQAELAAAERIGVIVMLRDQGLAAARARGPGAPEGRAALATLEARRERVISDALGHSTQTIGQADPTDTARIYARFDISGGFAATADASEIEALSHHPDVAGVFEDSLHAPSGPWSAPAASPAPSAPDSLELIGVHALWDAGLTGSGQTIAILDSGVALDHAAMEGAVIAGACFSSTLDGRSQSLCEGGVPELTSLTSGEPGADCLTLDVDPDNGIAGCGHGTHVASLAAGRHVTLTSGGRNYVVSGIAPDADVVAVKIFSQFEGDACDNYQGGPDVRTCLRARQSDYLRALEWLQVHQAELGLDVINMSFGGGIYSSPCETSPLRPVLQQLRDQGVLVFAAAGNESSRNGLAHPACVPEVIPIGVSFLTTSWGIAGYGAASFSNVAPYLDLLAPGISLLAGHATGPQDENGYCLQRGYRGAYRSVTVQDQCHYFKLLTGSSMASPTAAGGFALLRQAFPDASREDLLTAANFTGHISPEPLVGRVFSSLALEQAYDYLSRNRTLVADVSIEPEAPFRAVNETLDIESYSDGVYTLTNEGQTAVEIAIADVPVWLDVSSETLRILPGQSAELTLSIRKQLHLLPIHWSGHDSPFPRVDTAYLTLRSGPDQFLLPVSVSALGVLEAEGQYGPFPVVGRSATGAVSIFRIAGLYSGPPESLDIVFRNDTGSERERSFVTCSLPIRNQRYRGAEYLITPADLSDCSDLDFGQIYVQVRPQDDADYDGLRVRRFMLNSDHRLSDRVGDPTQNLRGTYVNYWSQGTDPASTYGPSDEVMSEPSTHEGDAAPGAAPIEPGYSRVSSRQLRWVGDHTNMMRSAFVFENLDGLVPTLAEFQIENPSGDTSALPDTQSGSSIYWCQIEINEDRLSWNSYLILPEDYAVCGEFGRAGITPHLHVPAESRAQDIEPIRYVVGPDGALTDVAGDSGHFFDAPESNENGDYSVSLKTVFEWVGDANAPTQNVFRFVPIDGAFRSIDIAITNAARGQYAGEFGDCEIEFDPDRYTGGDYLITSADLAQCGDFVRADLQFRLNGPQESFGRIVWAMRIGVGAHGDLTNFTFDHQLERGVSPEHHPDFDRVELGPFEWVGDTHAGTQSVFRLAGLDGELPTRIQVRLANTTYNTGWYENAFTDCEIVVNPERSSGGEFLILSRDLAQCGDFGRADIHFRIEAPDGTMQDGMRIRRFAVTSGGGLTDFNSDNERVTRVRGFD